MNEIPFSPYPWAWDQRFVNSCSFIDLYNKLGHKKYEDFPVKPEEKRPQWAVSLSSLSLLVWKSEEVQLLGYRLLIGQSAGSRKCPDVYWVPPKDGLLVCLYAEDQCVFTEHGTPCFSSWPPYWKSCMRFFTGLGSSDDHEQVKQLIHCCERLAEVFSDILWTFTNDIEACVGVSNSNPTGNTW